MKNSHILNLVIISSALLVACSSAAAPSESSRPTVTPIPIFNYNAPTVPPLFATAAEATSAARGTTAELDPERVSRGRDRYVVLECDACHSENGEGTNENTSLIGMTLSEADFITLMRSGGSLGSEHQYSTNRLSDSGGKNLYQYLLSLSE